MYAITRSARLAPKKANLMAKIVRGLPVPSAVELLRKTGKKSARLFEDLLRSAMANAEHNFKQDPQMMIVKEVVVNQGTSYRRGIPMARGRVRPIRKFLSHVSVTLGFSERIQRNQRKQKSQKMGETTATVSKKAAGKSSSVSSDSSGSSGSSDSSVSSASSDSSVSSS